MQALNITLLPKHAYELLYDFRIFNSALFEIESLKVFIFLKDLCDCRPFKISDRYVAKSQSLKFAFIIDQSCTHFFEAFRMDEFTQEYFKFYDTLGITEHFADCPAMAFFFKLH